MTKVSVIGAGSWGSALARILGDNNNDVLLYDTDALTVDEINNYHTNVSKLPTGSLPLNVNATTSLDAVMDFSDIIIISIPTKVLRSVLGDINKIIKTPKLFVNASKGLEPDTFLRVSEVVKEVIDNNKIEGFVALTGPSHAEEVILQLPTAISSVSENEAHAKLIQSLFNNNTYFRVYTGSDLVGSELCGAIKNVYAIASGMLHGAGYGDNARAAMITRSTVELRRIVLALGGREDTIFGLTGLGDLVVTTSSHHSRNFQAGVKLAKNNNLEETINSMTMVVEGARTCEAVYKLSKELKIDTPIIDAVYNVIYLKQDVRQQVNSIMNRVAKAE